MINKEKIQKKCKQCEGNFEVHQYRENTAFFCSKLCKNNSQKGIDIFKGMDRYWLKGQNNTNWKGGITSEYERIRKSLTYQEWRFSVYERDNFICKMCGFDEGGILNAHHIKRFCDYPELRFELSNGITLCEDCHKELHKGKRKIIVELNK